MIIKQDTESIKVPVGVVGGVDGSIEPEPTIKNTWIIQLL